MGWHLTVMSRRVVLYSADTDTRREIEDLARAAPRNTPETQENCRSSSTPAGLCPNGCISRLTSASLRRPTRRGATTACCSMYRTAATGWHWRHLTACRGRSILPGPPTGNGLSQDLFGSTRGRSSRRGRAAARRAGSLGTHPALKSQPRGRRRRALIRTWPEQKPVNAAGSQRNFETCA